MDEESWRERERQGWKQGRGIVSKSFEKGNPSNRSTNFWLTSIVHSEFVFRKKEIKDERWLFKGTRKRRVEESFQVYEINPWTTMEEETKVFFSVRADDPCCWKKRVEISSLFSLNSKGGSPSSSRIPDQRSILCSIGAFFTFKSTKRDWFVYRAKHCACVAMENEGGRSVDPLANSLVTMVFRTNRESEKTRESTRETGWNGLNFVPFFFFSFSCFRKGSLSPFFDGHAFPKTVYNIFSYACAVVRANARPPLGFFELLLGLFLNKLVFLFVRTGAELAANPVDGATGEYTDQSK